MNFNLKSGENATIKFVELSDAEKIRDMKDAHLLEDSPISIGDKTKLGSVTAWLKRSLKQIENKRYILIYAWLDDKIVGECSIECQEGSSSHVGELGISTINSFRRQGVASALLEAIETASRVIGIKTIKLTTEESNSPARKLYEKNGYKYYGKLPRTYLKNNKYIDQVLMYKEL